MRPREWFGVAVRVLGFWWLGYAAYSAMWVIWRSNGGAGNPNVTINEVAGSALIDFVRGVATLLLADPIVWLFYGLPPKPIADDETDGTATDGKG